MAEAITDCREYLAQAGKEFRELATCKDQVRQLETQAQQLDKGLADEKKAVEDTIARTIKKKEQEIHTECDRQISAAQDKLKKAKSKREKAKKQGIRDRIAEETAPFKAENRDLKGRMQTMFQNSRMPSFCMSHMYYSLYFPKRIDEFLTLLASLLVCFGALPMWLYWLIPDHRVWQLVIIYLVVIVVLGSAYMAIGNRTKPTHLEVLKEGRDIRRQIRENRGKMRKLAREIRQDTDEARYKLEKYDDEIAGVQQEISELTEKKNEALNTFENVTKTILKDEIEAQNKERLDKLAADATAAKDKLAGAKTQLGEKEQSVTERYEATLGKEFMDSAKIAALADIISQGKATDIPGAIEVYKGMAKG